MRGFARAILVTAWAAFWLNTALFPCCEVLAAALDDYSNDVSQSVSPTDSERTDQSPFSPCEYTVDAGPAINGAYAGLRTDRVDWEGFAIDASVSAGLTAVSDSKNLAPREYHPPPPLRLYLLTQRLLI